MKKTFIVTLCIAGVLCCTQKRPAVIERPVFEVWNSSTLEIDKIEMSDTATIFYFDAFYRPNNWIRIDNETYIRESGNNDKLFVTHSEGIDLSEETFMPESGTISFKLFFPPLKPKTTQIDFIESDCERCFKIYGIHLLPNAKIKFDPVPLDFISTTVDPLPAPGFSALPTKVSGRMSGYVDGIAPDAITIFTRNIVNNEASENKIAIASNGSFSGEIIPGMTGINGSSIGNLFLIPGKELKIYSDLKKRSRFQSRYRTDKEPGDSLYTYFSGCFTYDELHAITHSFNGLFDYMQLMQETVNMKPEAFKQHVLNILNDQINEQKQKEYSANTLMMIENICKLSTYTFLSQYESFMSAAYMQANNIKPEDRNMVAFVPEKPDAEYYSYLHGEITDEMSYLPNFLLLSTVLNNLYGMPHGNEKPATERLTYLKEKAAPVLGTDNSMIYDLIKVKYYGAQIDELKFFSDSEKQEIRNAFYDKPVLAEFLIAENDKLMAMVAASEDNKESILNETPPLIAQEKLLDAILAKYKGKVVLIDFWATWCGPCMAAMKSMLPMKEEMKGKDVVFLYLTGETSPLAAFTQIYPTITGEHYRVSDAQWGYWMNTFNISGIPTYMVYDRQGNQLSRHLGFPGVDEIRKSIEKGL